MKINLPVTQANIPFSKGKILTSKTDLIRRHYLPSDGFVEISGFARAELIGKRSNLSHHLDMSHQGFSEDRRGVL